MVNCIRKPLRAEGPSRRKVLSFCTSAVIIFGITLLLLVLLELALASSGVQPILYEEDPYVGFSSRIPLFVPDTTPDGVPMMVTAQNKLDLFNYQRFPAKKPAGTYRVFCMGGSTTYGRPYDDATSFCGWLRAMLPRADASRDWEVINAGGISYASYRVALLMEELIQYEPDLFVVYTGHNEFLEERTYRGIINAPHSSREFGAIMSRTRLYAVAKHAADRLDGASRMQADSPDLLPGEVKAILDQTVGPESYRRDDALQQQVIDHFNYNLERMVDIARSVGADVILVTPASNLRHSSPFKSEHRGGLAGASRRRWETAFRNASKAHTAGDHGAALADLDEAVQLDDRYALLDFRRGRVLWDLGRYGEAKDAFARARDQDVCPLRASTEMERIVRKVAERCEVPLVDFVAQVEALSPHGIPDDSVFFDHVHPTIECHRQLALALLNAMEREGFVHPVPDWDESEIEAVKEEVESRIDTKAHAVALRNLAKVLGWAGKFDEAYTAAVRATGLDPTDGEAYYHAARNAQELGRIEEAISLYRLAVDARPEYALAYLELGNALSAQGSSEEAIQQYEQALTAGPRFAALAHNNLGNELSALGKPEDAINHYRQAIELNPEYADAHTNLGLALSALGRSSQAIGHHREAVRIQPENGPAQYNLGLALAAEKRWQEAVDAFSEAARLMPGYAPARGHRDSALAEAERVKNTGKMPVPPRR